MPATKKPAEGRHKSVSRPQQNGFELAVDSHDDNVRQILVRFGRKVGTDTYQWARTIVLADLAASPGQSKSYLVSEDQLPVPPNECFYQFLLEVDGDHGPETLVTPPTKL
jgi:hypothetical protein